MSLFKSREFWGVNLNENEMYDSQCILTTALGDDKFQSILLGNHRGILRLFSPNSKSVEGVLNYKPSHLLLEVQLPSPILQISEGVLVSGSPNIYLAVLHPRQFSVYTIRKKENKESDIDQMEIEIVYQHVLRHTAHSFALGPFGGVRGRSFICIQSLDGLLSFYEQESFAFQLYLPTFILPFTFYYIEKTDSFLFLNGSLIFDCFSYEALASAGGSEQKKLTKTWEFNLGEGILDINIVTKDGVTLLILSEKNLYGINENGNMIFARRLEYKPVAFYSFLAEESRNLTIIVATDSGFLNFYEATDIKWSMKIDHIPVAVKRIFLNCLPGGIVLLTENGFLQVIYIGTHPSVYLVPPLIQPDIDIEKANSELQELQRKIDDNDVIDPLTADLVSVDLKIDKTIQLLNDVKRCNIMLEVSTQCLISKIQVFFIVESPLAVTNQSTTILNCWDKTFIENSAFFNDLDVVSSLTLKVIVTYVTSKGMIRSFQKNEILPLQLIVSETPPEKEALHKITITTNKPVCGANQLFKEFTSDDSFLNAIGLKYPNEDVVTVLAAKSSQKYRLQADSLAPITILLETLLERLKIFFQKDSEFSMSFSGSLPLDEYFKKISLHQQLIEKEKNLENILSKQTSQYITIQRKVLNNLKNVTPKSSNLYNLLKDTSQLIKTSLKELRAIEKELNFSRNCIKSLSRLIEILLELMPIKKDDLNILKIVFSPYVQDAEDQGWLEVQEAATSFFLRTVFAKSMKDQQKPHEISLKPITDVSKLTKRFTSIIDRVTKGTYLLERNDFEGKKEHLTTIQSAYESDDSFLDDVIPTAPKLFGVNRTKVEKPAKSGLQVEATSLAVVEEKDEEREKKNEIEVNLGNDKLTQKPQEIQQVPKSGSEVIKTQGKCEDEDDDGIWDVKVGEMHI